MNTTRLYSILLSFFLPLCGLAQAQTQSSGWSAGIRAGLTVAGVNRSAIRSFSGIPLSDIATQSVNTFHIGLIANRKLSQTFSIQPEILYNQYGGQVAGTATLGGFSSRTTVEVTIGAVEVPVLLKASFGQGTIRGFVNAGGFVAYSISNSVKTGTAAITGLIPDVNGKFIYGAVGGAGVTLALGPGQILLEGRYSYALGDNVGLDFGGGQLHYQIGLASIGYLWAF